MVKKKFLVINVVINLLYVIPLAEAGELINKHLPQYINVDLQFRYRFEYRDNLDFNDSVDDQDGFDLLRARLGISLMPVDNVKIFSQFQDARIANDEFGSKTAFEDYMDLRQLYIQLKDILGDGESWGRMSLQIGRQELSFGSQRLIGPVDWSNISQTFEVGRSTILLQDRKFKVDLFGGMLSPIKSPREMNDLVDGASHDSLWGYYTTWEAINKVAIEQYLIKRKTNKNISFGLSGSAELDEYTMGARITGKEINGFDYEIESAGQWGDFDDKDVSAMMAVFVVGYTFDKPWKPRLAFEFDYGSGDSDASDGTRKTFDNLYPTNHMHYGYMDLASLQNLNDYRIQLSVQPDKKLKLQSDMHLIYLDTYKDSLYNAGRSVVRTAPAAAGSNISTHVGNELDLLAKYDLNSHTNFLIGYSHLWAGDYLAQTGANEDGDFFYFQTTFNY